MSNISEKQKEKIKNDPTLSPSDLLKKLDKEFGVPESEFTIEGEQLLRDLGIHDRPMSKAKEALQEIGQIKAAQDRASAEQHRQQPTAPQKGDGGSER